MKKKFILCPLLALSLLCACAAPEQPSLSHELPSAEAPLPTESPTPTEVPLPTESPTPTEEPDSGFEAYIELVGDPNQPIYEGPGYDYGRCGRVELATGYTIVEEAQDDAGNIWGRLKSGAGWIDLSDSRAFDGVIDLVIADYADSSDPAEMDYFEPHDGDYHCFTEFTFSGPVTEVLLFRLEFAENGDFDEFYDLGEMLHSIPAMDGGESCRFALVFAGDLSAFGLRCTDEKGLVRDYIIFISLRNGELLLSEAAPSGDNVLIPDMEVPTEPTPDLDIQDS